MADELSGLVESIDGLYRLAPEEFVAAREALVKQLRADKRRVEANAVHGLARPSIAAWAANAVSRTKPELIEELIAASAALADASRSAITGGGATGFREAQTNRREAARRLVNAAVEFLTEQNRGGHPLDDLRALFDAAATDPNVATALRAARLTRAPDASDGFDLFAQTLPAEFPTQIVGAARAPTQRGATAADPALASAATKKPTARRSTSPPAAAREADRSAAEIAGAEAAIGEAARARDAAARVVESLSAEADTASAERDELERAFAAARERADAAAEAFDSGRRALQDADDALARARSRLDASRQAARG